MERSGKNFPRSRVHTHFDFAHESFLCFIPGHICFTLHLLSETERVDFQNLLPAPVVINIQDISGGIPWWNGTLPILIINNPLIMKFWCYSQLRENSIVGRRKKSPSKLLEWGENLLFLKMVYNRKSTLGSCLLSPPRMWGEPSRKTAPCLEFHSKQCLPSHLLMTFVFLNLIPR